LYKQLNIKNTEFQKKRAEFQTKQAEFQTKQAEFQTKQMEIITAATDQTFQEFLHSYCTYHF